MKQKKFMILLVAAAVAGIILLVILHFTGTGNSNSALQLLSLPFLPLFRLLARLSAGGGIGSGLATALWVLVSLLPLIPAVLIRGKKEVLAERLTWCAAAVFLFIALFNGFRLSGKNGAAFGNMEQLMYCLLIWTLVVTGIVLYLIRLFKKGDTTKLYRYLKIFLIILAFFSVAKIVLALSASGFLPTLLSGSLNDGYTLVYQLLIFLLTAVPAVLEILVILYALDMLDSVLSEDQEAIREAAKSLSHVCCQALAATVIFCAVINFLLFFFIGKTQQVNIDLHLPFTQLLFVLAALLFSRLATENRELKDDNSLFI